jgi:tRNA-specific 2-thiouridylase
VRVEQDAQGCFHLLKGLDKDKDQSYFLFTLTQEQLGQVLFPLGGLTKGEVRKLAAKYELLVAEKGESQEICFIPDDDYVRFIEEARGSGHLSGTIVDREGEVLGSHDGIYRYTVGQRKGLGIAHPHPLYVLQVDAGSRQVIVGGKDELFSEGLFARNMNWIISQPTAPLVATCKIRYRHQPVPCWVMPLADNRAEVRFPGREKAVTPGQAVVFYDGDEVLGGGWIE